MNYLLIKKVLLDNVSEGFTTIKNDIEEFSNSLKNEEALSSIKEKLDIEQKNIILRQEKKIRFVKFTALLILLTVIVTFLCIYKSLLWQKFKVFIDFLIGLTSN